MIRSAATLAAAATLAGCGIKGPLYLPEHNATVITRPGLAGAAPASAQPASGPVPGATAPGAAPLSGAPAPATAPKTGPVTATPSASAATTPAQAPPQKQDDSQQPQH